MAIKFLVLFYIGSVAWIEVGLDYNGPQTTQRLSSRPLTMTARVMSVWCASLFLTIKTTLR